MFNIDQSSKVKSHHYFLDTSKMIKVHNIKDIDIQKRLIGGGQLSIREWIRSVKSKTNTNQELFHSVCVDKNFIPETNIYDTNNDTHVITVFHKKYFNEVTKFLMNIESIARKVFVGLVVKESKGRTITNPCGITENVREYMSSTYQGKQSRELPLIYGIFERRKKYQSLNFPIQRIHQKMMRWK